MLVVKVWGLPKKTEEELQHVHDCIVKAAGLAEMSPVKTEKDLMVWFPQDLMRYGLGEQILVEFSGYGVGRIIYSLARRIGQALHVLFPKTSVECHHVSQDGSLWSSSEEEASGIPM